MAAPIAKVTNRRSGHIKGEPIRFIHPHQNSVPRVPLHLKKEVGHGDGYQVAMAKGHYRANRAGYVLLHILKAEKALGKPLPDGSEVHHVNGHADENANGNLVICESHAYHMILHYRAKALKECGHADWLRCSVCKSYAAAAAMKVYGNGNLNGVAKFIYLHHHCFKTSKQRQRRR